MSIFQHAIKIHFLPCSMLGKYCLAGADDICSCSLLTIVEYQIIIIQRGRYVHQVYDSSFKMHPVPRISMQFWFE